MRPVALLVTATRVGCLLVFVCMCVFVRVCVFIERSST